MYRDHHFHPLAYALSVSGLELMEANSLDEVVRLLKQYADQTTGAVIGRRLNDEGLAEQRLPVADEINGVVGDRPVLLYRYCGHIAVANSAALRLAGVDRDTPDPAGGSFDRDPSGRPNGILRETAITAVSQPLAPYISPLPDQDVLAALAHLPEMGIGSVTGIVSTGEPIWCGVTDELGALIRIAPDLPVDVDVLVIASTPSELAAAKERIDQAEGRISFLGWKEFADGSLGGHTAAMYDVYHDRPDTRGQVRLRHSDAVAMGQASLELGGVVAIHAIGDRANDLVLDVFDELIQLGVSPSRLRVEHASVLTNPTMDRMAHLGVTASVQPPFLASEESWLEKRLGPERMGRAYPFRSLLEAGVPLLAGSDAPVEIPDPEIGINAAVDRHGINPEEALTRAQAEALYAPQPFSRIERGP